MIQHEHSTGHSRRAYKANRSLPANGSGESWAPASDPIEDVETIVLLWRQRQDLRRAEGRLIRQAMAICRRVSANDKIAGARLWSDIRTGRADHPALEMVLLPYIEAMRPLVIGAVALERELVRRASGTALWSGWAVGVSGIGALTLAGLIGEAGRPLSEFRSSSGLWKRFGLAVTPDGRQRRMKGDAALDHGYCPERRGFAFVVSTNLLRQQKPGQRYRDRYDRQKAIELDRGIPKAHAHNRALRIMVKAFLRDAWEASRRVEPATINHQPIGAA